MLDDRGAVVAVVVLAASRVTVWSELQFEVVKVSEPPVLTLMSESWVPVVLRATVTVTSSLGLVVSLTL